MDGLRIYFDFTLPTLLLYNFEREQYQMVMKLTPHPAETKQGHHDELNGKITAEDKYGVVSSSTESSPVKQEFTNVFTNQTETKEGEGKCNWAHSNWRQLLWSPFLNPVFVYFFCCLCCHVLL